MKVRRCQAWGIAVVHATLDSKIAPLSIFLEQCEDPATYDGVRCHEHKDQKSVVWMEEEVEDE